jgi:hypothetical protein
MVVLVEKVVHTGSLLPGSGMTPGNGSGGDCGALASQLPWLVLIATLLQPAGVGEGVVAVHVTSAAVVPAVLAMLTVPV